MLARRIVVAAVIAAALALLGFLVVRDDGAIERRGGVGSEAAGATPSEVADMSATTGADVRSDLAAPRSASGRTSADAPSAATAIAKTFGELVRPIASGSRAPLENFTVVCTNAAGEQRRARGDDAVDASDLANGGVWIVDVPRHCPRVVDPERIAQRHANGSTVPLELELLASVTLTLVVEAPAPLRDSIARLVVTHDHAAVAARRWLAKSAAQSKSAAAPSADERSADQALPWNVAAVAEDVLALVRGNDVATTAAQRVQRIRRSPFIEAHAGLAYSRFEDDRLHELCWSSHVVEAPSGSTQVFADMPANTSLVILALGAAPLDFVRGDGSPIASHGDERIVRTVPFVLRENEANAIAVLHEDGATVRGRLPHDALPGARLVLSRDVMSNAKADEVWVTVRSDTPRFDADGRFEWSPIDAGDYVFTALWERPGNVSCRIRREFTLAPGEVLDLGELQPSASGRLTIHTHLVARSVLPSGFDAASHDLHAEVFGPLDANGEPPALRSEDSSREAILALDGTVVLDGLAFGDYGIALLGFRARQRVPGLRPADRNRLDELTNPTSLDLVRLLETGVVATVHVGAETVVHVDAIVGIVGASTLAVPLQGNVDWRAHELNATCMRLDGWGTFSTDAFELEIAADGTQRALSTTFLTPGEWVVFVSDVMRNASDDSLSIRVARHDITLTSATHTTTVVDLVPAASVRLRVAEGDDVAPHLADFGDREWTEGRWERTGDHHLLHGLLPHTRYRIGERVIKTGAPGSVVELD